MSPRDRADAEYTVLTTPAGHALLTEVGMVRHPGPANLARWRKVASPEQVAAALRLAECRGRGSAKFTRADRMWLEPTALEQATSEPVARYKAGRFGGRGVVDLCCGLGGDALALARRGNVLAVDADGAMGRRLRWNAEVYGVVDRLLAIRARAEAFPIPDRWSVHIDPDRRAGWRARARSLQGYVPGVDFLLQLPRRCPGGAMKLGPASDFDAHFAGPGFEVELVSLDGECKEATVWFGDLAGCRRRATCLPVGASWTDQDDGDDRARVGPIDSWVFDPDPALVRAGLLDRFAAANGLARVAVGIDLLTGPEWLDSPFLAGFAVDHVLSLDLRRLRRLVAEHHLGPLEIKTRGVDLTPESLRARLRPEGPNPATLLLIGGTGPARVILAHRRSPISAG